MHATHPASPAARPPGPDVSAGMERRSFLRRGSTGIGITEYSRRITS